MWVKYSSLFAIGLTPSLFLFKLIDINNISLEFLFVVLIFLVFILMLFIGLPKEKNVDLALSNEEKEMLQRHQEVYSLLLNKEKELIILQENFLKEQENFLEKLELINPEIADILIQKVLDKILKKIFAKDELSLINLKYLK